MRWAEARDGRWRRDGHGWRVGGGQTRASLLQTSVGYNRDGLCKDHVRGRIRAEFKLDIHTSGSD